MSTRRPSLAEMMGVSAAQSGSAGTLKLDQLPKILGDAMPDLPKNSVGRHRLVRALQQRFGQNWRSLPGVKDLVKEFDKDMDLEVRIAKLKQIKYKPRGK